jgi:2-polyprenyl-3-methyl-5-hydroxy-6-metoxy-1,4-benzoquinol methylase
VSGGVTRPAATEETPCNLCGASDYEVVGRKDRHGHPLRTVICRVCGLVWINPRPPAAAMDRYYASEYRADYKGALAPPLRKVLRGMAGARDRYRAIQPLVRAQTGGPAAPFSGWKVLDVGCGAGEFVCLLRHAGADASGLEPGLEYAEFARQVLQIPVQTATVDTALVEPGSQDLVTMFHSLEHVPDPRTVLTTVRGWLKAGGWLVVEVPNVESTAQAPAHRFHYAHLYHFSGTTLAALGEAAGLRTIRTDYSPDGGNLTCVFRREGDEPQAPSGLEAAAARTAAVLKGHHTLSHYFSAIPYRRAVDRLRRRWREDRLLRRLRTTSAVIAWATSSLLADAHKSRLH